MTIFFLLFNVLLLVALVDFDSSFGNDSQQADFDLNFIPLINAYQSLLWGKNKDGTFQLDKLKKEFDSEIIYIVITGLQA